MRKIAFIPASLYLTILTLFWSMTSADAQTIARDEPVRLLALGDSYTIGEGVAREESWPVQMINALMLKGFTCHQPEIVATTGWRTDDLKQHLKASTLPKDYNLVTLLIGVNNQYQRKSLHEYEREFEELLIMAIEYAEGNRENVVVLSIPDYGYTPFGSSDQARISSEIDAFNAANKKTADAYRIRYVDITGISRRGLHEEGLLADDGLHPSGKMYALWVERLLNALL